MQCWFDNSGRPISMIRPATLYWQPQSKGHIFHINSCCIFQVRQITQILTVVGLLNIHSSVSPVRKFSFCPKYLLGSLNHFHIWWVTPQLSCGDTCQIWMLFSIGLPVFWPWKKIGKIMLWGDCFSTHHPMSCQTAWWIGRLVEISKRVMMKIGSPWANSMVNCLTLINFDPSMDK